MAEQVATYSPLMVCESHGFSFHENATAAHVARWGSTVSPCCVRMLTLEEHAQCGWGTANYPVSVSVSAEDDFVAGQPIMSADTR